MESQAATALAPSSKLALYLAALIAVYVVHDPALTIEIAVGLSIIALVSVRIGGGRIPMTRWRLPLVFVAWVFIMHLALDVAGGASVSDSSVVLSATRQSSRVAFLVVGALAFIALTPARSVVEELEMTRLPRSMRLLVMMLVQYPRVLRDRYDQIVEAQIARGADRPRSIVQRVAQGARILLPVMQSELNAIGERAGLIHLRGLDVDVQIKTDIVARSTNDVVARGVAAAILLAAIGTRILWR